MDEPNRNSFASWKIDFGAVENALLLHGVTPLPAELRQSLSACSRRATCANLVGASGATSPIIPNCEEIVLTESVQLASDPDAYDVILCFWALQHSPDPISLLREIQRVLKPGGKLLLIEGVDLAGSPEQELHRQANHLINAIEQMENPSNAGLLSPSEVVEVAHAGGFTEMQAEKISRLKTSEDAAALSLRAELLRLLTQIYPVRIKSIPNGEKRWGGKLADLAMRVSSQSVALHPFMVVTARKPEAAPSNTVSGLVKGYSLRFRELPDETKPREKLLLHGPGALKNHELLAVMLGSGTTRENVIELARRMLKEYGSRALAQERSVRRLRDTLGIGVTKASQIVAAFELGRRFFEEPLKKAPIIFSPEDAYQYLREISKFTKEHFRGLYLNVRGRIVRDEIISIGTLTTSLAHPREVFLPAVEFAAAAVILAHNHPSGDPTPSEEDLHLTRQMIQAGKVMGIEIFDHLIIGEDGFVSLLHSDYAKIL